MNGLLQAEFNSTNSSFTCRFIGDYGTGLMSCKIVYGLCNHQMNDSEECVSSGVKAEAESIAYGNIAESAVTVSILPLAKTVSKFCFLAIGKTPNFTIAVEGYFNTGMFSCILWI